MYKTGQRISFESCLPDSRILCNTFLASTIECSHRKTPRRWYDAIVMSNLNGSQALKVKTSDAEQVIKILVGKNIRTQSPRIRRMLDGV